MKKALLRSAAVAALAMASAFAGANAEAANLGAWTTYANGPTIYQTNWMYYSEYMNPLIGTPTTATVTGFNWVLNLSYYPAGTAAGIFTSGGLVYQVPSISGSVSGGGTLSANQPFRFGFNIMQSTTHTLNPPVYGGGHQLTVSYQY